MAHARDISTRQKAELFVGGLPDHIRVDVEMLDPGDLQTAMYLARAFERRAEAMAVPTQRGVRPPQRSGPSARVLAGGATLAAAAGPTVSAPSGSVTATPA